MTWRDDLAEFVPNWIGMSTVPVSEIANFLNEKETTVIKVERWMSTDFGPELVDIYMEPGEWADALAKAEGCAGTVDRTPTGLKVSVMTRDGAVILETHLSHVGVE